MEAGFSYNNPKKNKHLGPVPPVLSMKDYCKKTGSLEFNFQIDKAKECPKKCVSGIELSLVVTGESSITSAYSRCERRAPFTFPGDQGRKRRRKYYGFTPDGPTMLALSATAYRGKPEKKRGGKQYDGNAIGYHQQMVQLVDPPVVESLEIVQASTGDIIQQLAGNPILDKSLLDGADLSGWVVQAVLVDQKIFKKCITEVRIRLKDSNGVIVAESANSCGSPPYLLMEGCGASFPVQSEDNPFLTLPATDTTDDTTRHSVEACVLFGEYEHCTTEEFHWTDSDLNLPLSVPTPSPSSFMATELPTPGPTSKNPAPKKVAPPLSFALNWVGDGKLLRYEKK